MPTPESMLPSQRAEDLRQISRAEIEQLLRKPEDNWTEEDAELLCLYNAQQQAAERKRQEEKDAARRKGQERTAKYWECVRKQEKDAQNDGSLEFFLRELNKHRSKPNPIRIEEHADKAQQFLEAAYKMEVDRRGGNYQGDHYTTTALTAISRWLTTHKKPGLMLRGYIGIGKTTMLYAIRDVLQVLLKQEIKIVDARTIAALGRDNPSALKTLSETPLLGIDDLGTEPTTVKSYGNELSPVGELLTERYTHQRFTVITTNLTTKVSEGKTSDELLEVYGDRLFDRFQEMFNQVHYDANQKSYRK